MRIYRGVLTALMCAGLLAGSTGLVMAEKGEGGGWHHKKFGGKGDHQKEIFESLGLSEEQKARLTENRKKFKESGKEAMEAIRKTREELKAEMSKPELDMNRVNQLHAQLKDQIIKREDARLANILEVRKILTPEQYKQFQDKMKAKWEQKKKMMQEKMGKEGAGPEKDDEASE